MNTLPQQSPITQDPANYKPTLQERARIQEQIERHGHGGVFADHRCPECDHSWECASVEHCRKTEDSHCKECTTNEFISDVDRLLDIVASHMRFSDDNPHRGLLEGLIQRAQELGRWS